MLDVLKDLLRIVINALTEASRQQHVTTQSPNPVPSSIGSGRVIDIPSAGL